MKRLIIVTFAFVVLSSCSGKKEKTKTAGTNTEKSTTDKANDKAIADWLQGKEWKAKEGGAPMSILRIYADGHCEYGTSSDKWSYRNGEFGVHMGDSKNPLVTWPVKKLDEQSFSLYVEPTKESFVYSIVRTL